MSKMENQNFIWDCFYMKRNKMKMLVDFGRLQIRKGFQGQ